MHTWIITGPKFVPIGHMAGNLVHGNHKLKPRFLALVAGGLGEGKTFLIIVFLIPLL